MEICSNRALTGLSTGLAVDTFGASYAITSALGFGIEGRKEVNLGRTLISGGIDALLAGAGVQINGLTAGLSRVSYITAQVMLGGSASLLGIGYSAISSYYYNRAPSNDNMILDK